MLRDPSLIPLSRQHQHALALCVRIERALRTNVTELEPWQEEIARDFEQEIQFHFASEEQVLFQAARRFDTLRSLVDELIAEHGQLRKHFARAKDGLLTATELAEFAKLLSAHIRKEERHLFEEMQKLISPEDMKALGVELNRSLQRAQRACALRSQEK